VGLFDRFRKQPEHKTATREVSVAKLKRFYEAAQNSDLYAGWTNVPIPTQFLIRNSLRVLRARSREQVQNNEYARRFIQLLKVNVVGPKGFTFQAQIKNGQGKPDKQANAFIEDMVKDWSRRENLDVTGRMDLVGHCRMFLSEVATDGEYLARIIRGRRAGRHGIQIQVLDPEILPVWYEKDVGSGGRIESGVEFNAFGKPVAYHLMAYGPTEDTYSYYGRSFVRVPAEDIIHEFMPEWVDQYRGLPWFSTALNGLKMANGYEEAALVAARVGAANMAFFKTTGAEDLPFDEKSPEGDFEMDAEAGVMRSLPPGMELDKWDPKYPDSQFEGFMKAVLRRTASGLGINYNALANDLSSVNYSSLRQGALEDRDAWMLIQDWMASVFLDRLYREWLTWQMTTGGVTLPMRPPASLQITNEAKYMDVAWLGRRWHWIDPQKDMTANTAAIFHGLKSKSQIIREMGHDPDRIWHEISVEDKKLEELGLTFPIEAAPALKVEEKIDD